MESFEEKLLRFEQSDELSLDADIMPCPEDSCEIINSLLDIDNRELEKLEVYSKGEYLIDDSFIISLGELDRIRILQNMKEEYKYASKQEIIDAINVLMNLL